MAKRIRTKISATKRGVGDKKYRLQNMSPTKYIGGIMYQQLYKKNLNNFFHQQT
jgi:hypothetical protein